MAEIINRIAQSGLITLDLEEYMPDESALVSFDVKPFLFKEMILREKDFRVALPKVDWSQYRDKFVAIFCSTEAIIPMWAYMLISSSLCGIAKDVYFGTTEELEKYLLLQNIQQISVSDYQDARLIIKGCANRSIPEAAYVAITYKLQSVVKTLMFGEPCSTVPVYKKK